VEHGSSVRSTPLPAASNPKLLLETVRGKLLKRAQYGRKQIGLVGAVGVGILLHEKSPTNSRVATALTEAITTLCYEGGSRWGEACLGLLVRACRRTPVCQCLLSHSFMMMAHGLLGTPINYEASAACR
jgi:hypothetical protein